MPYSTDLHQRVVDAYNEDIMTTYAQVAERFLVSESFVSSIHRRYHNSGSVEPVIRQEQTPTKLSAEQLSLLKELIEEDNDATLQELCVALAKRVKVKIAVSTMVRMIQKLGITRKKNIKR